MAVEANNRDHAAVGKEFPVSIGADQGIVNKPSRYPVDETVDRLTSALHARGITLFAVIDHSGEAAKAGMFLRPTKLMIFGSPKGGTPVMVAASSSALDLPLKLLVRQDPDNQVLVSYNSPKYLQERHQFPVDLLPNLAIVDALATSMSE
jgi:uncharacterized protein (DUF302 family)